MFLKNIFSGILPYQSPQNNLFMVLLFIFNQRLLLMLHSLCDSWHGLQNAKNLHLFPRTITSLLNLLISLVGCLVLVTWMFVWYALDLCTLAWLIAEIRHQL